MLYRLHQSLSADAAKDRIVPVWEPVCQLSAGPRAGWPPERQGIMIGYTSIGSISSRSRRFTVIALNVVPTTDMPHVVSKQHQQQLPELARSSSRYRRCRRPAGRRTPAASSKTKFATVFPKNSAATGDRRSQQSVQAVVRQIAREAAVDNQRARKCEHEPEQAARQFLDLFRIGIEREAEQQQDHERRTKAKR